MMTQTRGYVAALMAAAATTLLLCRATGLRQERSQVRARTGDGHFAARVRAQAEA